jgi:hypothetical protein
MSRHLPPCDHDECPPTRCLRVGSANEPRLVGCDALVMPPSGPFVTMMMDMPGGGKQGLQLDEEAARHMLLEMETWGDDCSQDSKYLRAALRENLRHNSIITILLSRFVSLHLFPADDVATKLQPVKLPDPVHPEAPARDASHSDAGGRSASGMR